VAAKVKLGHRKVVPHAIPLAMAIIVDFFFTGWLPSDWMKIFIGSLRVERQSSRYQKVLIHTD
jgi:hypothetical protein